METGEKITFNCVVKSKSQEADGGLLELEIAEFYSDWPIRINRVSSEIADLLEPGNSYQLVLKRQNLKKGKAQDKLYNWYWGLDSIASGPVRSTESVSMPQDESPHDGEPVVEPLWPEDTPTRRRPINLLSSADARDILIMRESALKSAVEHGKEKRLKALQVIQVATVFGTFLLTGKAPKSETKVSDL